MQHLENFSCLYENFGLFKVLPLGVYSSLEVKSLGIRHRQYGISYIQYNGSCVVPILDYTIQKHFSPGLAVEARTTIQMPYHIEKQYKRRHKPIATLFSSICRSNILLTIPVVQLQFDMIQHQNIQHAWIKNRRIFMWKVYYQRQADTTTTIALDSQME